MPAPPLSACRVLPLVLVLSLGGCRSKQEPYPTIAPGAYWEPGASGSETGLSVPPGSSTGFTREAPNDTRLQRGDSGAIVADHRGPASFASIPKCWLERGAKVRVAYQHTSHGSQIVSGLEYLANTLGASYAVGEPNGLALRDGVMSKLAPNANDLGYDGWSQATRAYLGANPATDAVMWSWCGQVGSHVADMQTYLFEPAHSVTAGTKARFIFMTGHLDGSGPEGNVWRANELIRQHAQQTQGILFDFADIESYDPAGRAYPTGSDACEWCSAWCTSHPQDCRNLPHCAHSHGFNCVQKGKAYWWLVARMAGWNGSADHGC